MPEKEKKSIIGVIPQYPKHSQQNVYARVKMPPLGIVSVLSQINDKGFDAYIIDENNYSGPKNYEGEPDHYFLHKRKPSNIAMFYGGMTNSIPRMYSLAKQYKDFGSITIAGGSHVDALPLEALYSYIDIVVHGEGEYSTKEILEVLENNEDIKKSKKSLEKITGISFLGDSGEYVFTGKREPIKDLDSLRDSDLTLVRFLENKMTAIPIDSGRGCNFNCEFCVVHNQYGKPKSPSNNKIMNQIIKYSDLGYKDFFFTCDNFARDALKTIELCKMIGDYTEKFNKKIESTVQVRSDVAENDKLIEAMKYSGITTLCIGYESPIDEELKAMKKGVTAQKLTDRSRKLSKDFYLHGMFIYGYPTFADSKFKSDLTLKQKAKAYSKFFKDSQLDTIQVFNAIPLLGSELRHKLVGENRVLPLEDVGWDKYDGLFLNYIPEEKINAYDLQNFPKLLMKKKYLGGFVNQNLNYGNWMDWVYNSTIGFPLQFSIFYTKRFFHNLNEHMKERDFIKKRESLLPKRNIFHAPLVNAFGDIKRKWRNLALKTYGGNRVRGWFKEYKKTKFSEILDKLK